MFQTDHKTVAKYGAATSTIDSDEMLALLEIVLEETTFAAFRKESQLFPYPTKVKNFPSSGPLATFSNAKFQLVPQRRHQDMQF